MKIIDSKKEKQKMTEILENEMENQEDQSDEEYYRLIELLEKENIDIEDLNASERDQFLHDFKLGTLFKDIPVYQPWWLKKIEDHNRELVSEECEDDFEILDIFNEKPPCNRSGKVSIPIIESSKKGSEMLKYHILVVIVSYIISIRKYNGIIHDDCASFIGYITEICPIFHSQKKYSSIIEIIADGIIKNEKSLVEDISCILSEPHYIEDILYDLYAVFIEAIDSEDFDKSDKKEIRKILLKLNYIYSYSQFMEKSIWEKVKLELVIELKRNF